MKELITQPVKWVEFSYFQILSWCSRNPIPPAARLENPKIAPALNSLFLNQITQLIQYVLISDTARRLFSLQRIRHPLTFPTRPPVNNGLLSYLSQHETWVSVRSPFSWRFWRKVLDCYSGYFFRRVRSPFLFIGSTTWNTDVQNIFEASELRPKQKKTSRTSKTY